MNKLILLFLLLAAPLSLKARPDDVPLLAENEHESNRFGYHVMCSVSDDITLRVEISPAAAMAIKGIRLMIWDESGHHLDMELKGTQQKDGTIVLSVTLPKTWAEKSELGIFSRPYDGSGGSIDFAGYSFCFKNALKK